MARSQKQTFDSTAGGLASIPGQGTKISTSHKTKWKKKKKRTFEWKGKLQNDDWYNMKILL